MGMHKICLHSLPYRITEHQPFFQCQQCKHGTDLLNSSESNMRRADVTGESCPLSVYTSFTKERVFSGFNLNSLMPLDFGSCRQSQLEFINN